MGHSIPSLVQFEQILDPTKKTYFKIRYLRNSQISVWNTNFFPRQAIAKILLFYNLDTHGTLDTEFGLIWTTPWPYEKYYI